jgi:hypothetical protein
VKDELHQRKKEIFLFLGRYRCDKQIECYLLVRSFVLICACLCLLTGYNNPQAIEEGEEEEEEEKTSSR